MRPTLRKIILPEPNLMGFYQSLTDQGKEKFSILAGSSLPHIGEEKLSIPTPSGHPVPPKTNKQTNLRS